MHVDDYRRDTMHRYMYGFECRFREVFRYRKFLVSSLETDVSLGNIVIKEQTYRSLS